MVRRSVAGMHKLGRSIVSVLAHRFAVGPFWNWRTSPSVTRCAFFVASGRVGLDYLRSTACSGFGSTDYGHAV